ncbi:hypothetical protein KLP40_14895 [Hymenobacter sp. NST-14]|uniref:hypothetical protein n=1 Tax=Hymenobacter piscis TaxID=2839984 RepID=UPI001C01BBCC|nr:hypothetical protein [Hymenobacter piscis]MBT9394457.1 hypothetical protein [Hymenobacter piscis]
METITTSQTKTMAATSSEAYVPNPLLASPEADRFASHCLLMLETCNYEHSESVTTMQPA